MKRFMTATRKIFTPIIFLLFTPVYFLNAQTVTWANAAAATDWYTAANWLPSTSAAAWLPTNIALFNNTGSATAAGINMNSSSLSIGAVNLTGRHRALAIGNSGTVDGTLQLNGATISGFTNVIIHNSSIIPPSPLTIQKNVGAGTGAMELVLGNAVDNIILADGPLGTITIAVPVSGAGKKLTLRSTVTDGSTVTLSAACTYTGLTTINARMSRLVLNKPGGGTLPFRNDVLVADGSLEVNTNQTLRNITINGTGRVVVGNGATLTVTGTLTKSDPGAVILSGGGRIVYTTGASLKYTSGATATIGNEFPALYGPTNVEFNALAGSLPFSRAIAGTLTIIGNLLLNNNDITARNVIGSGHIITNGFGKLNITSIGATPVTFPIAAALGQNNPVTISNGQGLTYGVRVEAGINPPGVTDASKCVNRTWNITPVGPLSASPVNLSFYYTAADVNPGFSHTATVDVGSFISPNWTVAQAGITQVIPLPSSIAFMILGGANTFVIGNTSAVH